MNLRQYLNELEEKFIETAETGRGWDISGDLVIVEKEYDEGVNGEIYYKNVYIAEVVENEGTYTVYLIDIDKIMGNVVGWTNIDKAGYICLLAYVAEAAYNINETHEVEAD